MLEVDMYMESVLDIQKLYNEWVYGLACLDKKEEYNSNFGHKSRKNTNFLKLLE